MKKMILSAIFFLLTVLLMTPPVWAHPPSQINLAYDKETKTLQIDIRHVSKNPRRHHIRKVIVYKNDLEVDEYYFVTQTTANAQIKDVMIEAETGDTLKVKAICNKAGYREKTLIVP